MGGFSSGNKTQSGQAGPWESHCWGKRRAACLVGVDRETQKWGQVLPSDAPPRSACCQTEASQRWTATLMTSRDHAHLGLNPDLDSQSTCRSASSPLSVGTSGDGGAHGRGGSTDWALFGKVVPATSWQVQRCPCFWSSQTVHSSNALCLGLRPWHRRHPALSLCSPFRTPAAVTNSRCMSGMPGPA